MNFENYDPSFPDQPVVDLYLSVWANLPAFRSKPAFVWIDDGSPHATNASTSSTLTYSQLNDSVHSISNHLLASFQRGETVLILCSPGLDLVEVIFGCQRAGLLSVPIVPPNPSFSKGNYHQLFRVLSQTKPKAAIAHRSYIAEVHRYISSSSKNTDLVRLLQNLTWISSDDIKGGKTLLNLKNSGSSSSYKGCKVDEVYLIQYTSGATGIPKPVLVTAGSAAHNVRTARKAYDLHPNSVIISWLPQYHDCGLMFLLLTIVSGATCVLTSPDAFVKRPRLWLELITKFSATCTPVPSFTLPLVVKRGGIEQGTSHINLWSLRNLILINEPIYRAPVEEFVRVFKPFGLNPSSISPSYGLAENCTFVSTAWRPNNYGAGFPNIPTHKKLLPSAKLADRANETDEDMDIVIVNEETREAVEDGIEGEIWVSSPSNASGYLGHPSLTREVFYGLLSDRLSRCFVRTGDRGIVKGSEERHLFVTGRCSDIIKLPNKEEIVHPHYVETAAHNSCPGFIRGGCLAAFEIWSKVVVVAEVAQMKKQKEMFKEDDVVLRRICEGIRKFVLRDEGVEAGLVVLVKSGSVPKTTSGKIQRWAAKEKLARGQMSVVMEMRFGDDHGSSGTKLDDGSRGYNDVAANELVTT
ncbi:hypothetical protein FNV43_RR11502 [Rhamnella rubrinervis]|uniref:AMP-dependent synthetase/ligase domain-containing protein n=1 Tax=Rhamnella rubrinervis TaxID=2594499 RepID=A0A8K0H6I3_9ROSA|nr:hypothetical protein FNV43_RR11502 [Rhamnella rubrinervis]